MYYYDKGSELMNHDDPFIILPDRIMYYHDRDLELFDPDDPFIILPDEIMYDDVRGPELFDHVGPHVDLSLAPVRRVVQYHPKIFSQIFTQQKKSFFSQKMET